MCGIIGFTGYESAPEVLLRGLSELEYRGYDSAGIACVTEEGTRLIKRVGKVANLKEAVPDDFASACGIGHTRWATHGGVSEANAHPHLCGRVTLIHNGIIENYLELTSELASQGKTPVSETDSEIAAMLLDTYYEGDAAEALRKLEGMLVGSYAFCILFSDQPEVIYCMRKGSPLVICSSEEGSVVASDPVALLRYAKEYFVLREGDLARLTRDGVVVTDPTGASVTPEMIHVTWEAASAQKNGFRHFMQKEIHEQPEALRRTIAPRIVKTMQDDTAYLLPDFVVDGIPDAVFAGITRVVITACGTAMHAGLVGKVLLERFLRIPTSVDIASEFRYQDPILDEHTLVITVSQSGETADTLAALRLAREHGARTLAIVNVRGSSIARESEYVLCTHAGPEIAVASTKAYTAQLVAFYLLVFRFGFARGTIPIAQCSELTGNLLRVISIVEETLALQRDIERISKELIHAEDLFFIGRGLDNALSSEGSIKLKEISYIHSEAYAAGELKHGTLSLVSDGVPVIALATQDDVRAKTISNMKEVRARGARVICITTPGANIEPELYDDLIELPERSSLFAPFSAAVVLQLLAYYTAAYRGLDVDQPRNLAKSVTVE